MVRMMLQMMKMTMRIEGFCGFDHEPSKRGGGSEKEEYFTNEHAHVVQGEQVLPEQNALQCILINI